MALDTSIFRALMLSLLRHHPHRLLAASFLMAFAGDSINQPHCPARRNRSTRASMVMGLGQAGTTSDISDGGLGHHMELHRSIEPAEQSGSGHALTHKRRFAMATCVSTFDACPIERLAHLASHGSAESNRCTLCVAISRTIPHAVNADERSN